MKINFVRSLLRKGYLKSDCSIMPYFLVIAVFGSIRLLEGWLSLLGRSISKEVAYDSGGLVLHV